MSYPKFCLFFILLLLSQEAIGRKLPDDSRPYHYEILMFPSSNREINKFEGESTISLEIFRPTVNLTLHSANLTINFESTKLTANNIDLKPRNHFFEIESQFLILNFENELQPGKYQLHLNYFGKIEEGSNSSYGFFRETHMNR